MTISIQTIVNKPKIAKQQQKVGYFYWIKKITSSVLTLIAFNSAYSAYYIIRDYNYPPDDTKTFTIEVCLLDNDNNIIKCIQNKTIPTMVATTATYFLFRFGVYPIGKNFWEKFRKKFEGIYDGSTLGNVSNQGDFIKNT